MTKDTDTVARMKLLALIKGEKGNRIYGWSDLAVRVKRPVPWVLKAYEKLAAKGLI